MLLRLFYKSDYDGSVHRTWHGEPCQAQKLRDAFSKSLKSSLTFISHDAY